MHAFMCVHALMYVLFGTNVYEYSCEFVAEVCPPHSRVLHAHAHNTHTHTHTHKHTKHTHLPHTQTQHIHTHTTHTHARTDKYTYTHTSVRARTLSISLAFSLALSLSLSLNHTYKIAEYSSGHPNNQKKKRGVDPRTSESPPKKPQ